MLALATKHVIKLDVKGAGRTAKVSRFVVERFSELSVKEGLKNLPGFLLPTFSWSEARRCLLLATITKFFLATGLLFNTLLVDEIGIINCRVC